MSASTADAGDTDNMHDVNALAAADEARVIEGTDFDPAKRSNNKQLTAERNRTAISEIALLLADWTSHEPMDWMEWPTASVVFLKEREVLAEFGLLSSATWVRTSADGDRELARHGEVVSWLAQRGIQLL